MAAIGSRIQQDTVDDIVRLHMGRINVDRNDFFWGERMLAEC